MGCLPLCILSNKSNSCSQLTPQPPYGAALQTQFFAASFFRVKTFSRFPLGHLLPSPPHAARAPADAEIFLLIRLSHKDGIKKVENTSALAFPLQAVGMIRRQSGVSMQLIEADVRFLRHELQSFLVRPKSLRPIHICDIFHQYLRSSMQQITLRPSERPTFLSCQ